MQELFQQMGVPSLIERSKNILMDKKPNRKYFMAGAGLIENIPQIYNL